MKNEFDILKFDQKVSKFNKRLFLSIGFSLLDDEEESHY